MSFDLNVSKFSGFVSWDNGASSGGNNNTVVRGMTEAVASLLAGNRKAGPTHIGFVAGNSPTPVLVDNPKASDTYPDLLALIQGTSSNLFVFPLSSTPAIAAGPAGTTSITVNSVSVTPTPEASKITGNADFVTNDKVEAVMLLSKGADNIYKLLAWSKLPNTPVKNNNAEFAIYWTINIG